MLLACPFHEAVEKGDCFKKHLQRVLVSFVAEDRALSNAHKHHLTFVYMEAVDKVLQHRRSPQHGVRLGEGSVPGLLEILTSIDLSHAVKNIPSGGLASDINFGPESFQRLHTSFSRVLVQTVNLPLLPGEAAKLVRCWTSIVHKDDRTTAMNTAHSSAVLSSHMAYTLMGNSATSTSSSAFVADGTPSLPILVPSWEQSAVECIEAIFDSGRTCWMQANAEWGL